MPLATRLRDAIEESGLSQRKVARELSSRTGSTFESERRQIAKYLASENIPRPRRARLLSEILGKPNDYFIDPAEAQMRSIDQLRKLVALIDELEAAVTEHNSTVTGRLGAVEATVAKQGANMTKALNGVARRLARVEEVLLRLEHLQDPPIRRANH